LIRTLTGHGRRLAPLAHSMAGRPARPAALNGLQPGRDAQTERVRGNRLLDGFPQRKKTPSWSSSSRTGGRASLRKPNYNHERAQRDKAREEKAKEKAQKKLEAKAAASAAQPPAEETGPEER
jgi:hypothetical protein